MAAQYKHEAIETQRPLDIEKRSDSDDERPLAKAGTNQDDLDMDRLGKKQQLSRNFRSFSILGLTCVVMGTWLGMITASSFSLINGGRAGTIWVYVAVWFCSLAVVASMAEMASMAPTSGGQYHWVSVRFSEVHVFQSQPETSANNYTFLLQEFAPPNAQKFLSYLSGWLSALGWQAFVAVAAYQAGAMILVLASVNESSYSPTPWWADICQNNQLDISS